MFFTVSHYCQISVTYQKTDYNFHIYSTNNKFTSLRGMSGHVLIKSVLFSVPAGHAGRRPSQQHAKLW